MKNICFFCNQPRRLDFRVTEVESNDYISFSICAQCAAEYIKSGKTSPSKPAGRTVDIKKFKSHIDLLNTLLHIEHKDEFKCKRCGLTQSEFESKGRFGCPECYDHFQEKMKNLVIPYHGGNEHVGKTPKKWLASQKLSKEEELKTLKLQYAKAIEIEDYEKAAILKKQLDLIQEPSSTSEGQ